MRRTGPDRAQDGHFAPALAEARQHHRHHAEESVATTKTEIAESAASAVPIRSQRLLQRDAGKDREQRFGPVFVDPPLQAEHRETRLEPTRKAVIDFGVRSMSRTASA